MIKAIKLVGYKLTTKTALTVYAIIMTGWFLWAVGNIIYAVATGHLRHVPFDLLG